MNALKWSDKKSLIRNSLLNKYPIIQKQKDEWTIFQDYDVLDNYLQYRFKYVDISKHICYDKYEFDNFKGEIYPLAEAKIAAFDTGLKGRSDRLTTIWIVFELVDQQWQFEDFYLPGVDDRKKGRALLDKIPTDGKSEFIFYKNDISKKVSIHWKNIRNFDSENLIFRNHILFKDAKKDRPQFLSKELRSCFYKFINGEDKNRDWRQKKIIIDLLECNLRKCPGVDDFQKRIHWKWECPSNKTIKDEDDYLSLSMLCPIYILSTYPEVPDVIVAITLKEKCKQNMLFQVETVLSMSDAYRDAKLVDPDLVSTWLTRDNVIKSLKNR